MDIIVTSLLIIGSIIVSAPIVLLTMRRHIIDFVKIGVMEAMLERDKQRLAIRKAAMEEMNGEDI